MRKITSLLTILALLATLTPATFAEDGTTDSTTATETTETTDSTTATATTSTAADTDSTGTEEAVTTETNTNAESTATTTSDPEVTDPTTDTDTTENSDTDTTTESVEVDNQKDCTDFDRNSDGTIDPYEHELCRAKKLNEHFENVKNINCANFDANNDGTVDADDVRSCRVHKSQKLKNMAEKKLEQIAEKQEHLEKTLRPLLLEIRWGTLDGLDESATPFAYTGEITVNGGTAKILHSILFEDGDQITVDEGDTVSWQSTAGTHFDGILVKLKANQPEFDTAGTLTSTHSFTISLGDYSQTWQAGAADAASIFGRHDLGNGHTLEIKNIANLDEAPKNVSAAVEDKLLEHKTKVSEKLDQAQAKLRELREKNHLSQQAQEQFENISSDINEYNLYGTAADDIQAALTQLISDAQDSNLSKEEIAQKITQLQRDFNAAKKRARLAKFEAGLVPFKDVDDNEWYGNFVTYAKDNGIVSGYKGDRIGEYGPGDLVTVAEVLKMALGAADQGEATTADDRAKFRDHWANKFFQKAKELGLTMGTDDTLDPNRPATRGEVANLVLESLGIIPPTVSDKPFADVAANHQHAAAIAYLKDAGVISGDSTGNTFRPDETINRAEVAKIIKNMIELLKNQI
jgi:uncharacterized coiled-coil DUF342 family protein